MWVTRGVGNDTEIEFEYTMLYQLLVYHFSYEGEGPEKGVTTQKWVFLTVTCKESLSLRQNLNGSFLGT